MNQPEEFASHLTELGIFNEEDQDQYLELVSTEKPEDDEEDIETKMIFTLADLLKSYDAEDFYDLAERLFKKWGQGANRNYTKANETVLSVCVKHMVAKRLSNALNKIREYALSKKEKYEEVSIAESNEVFDETQQIQLVKRSNYKTPSKSTIRPGSVSTVQFNEHLSEKLETPVSVRIEHSPKENVFTKLHSAANIKRQTLAMKEEIKKKRETELCTFKPRVNSSRSVSRENVYERLAHTSRGEKYQYLEIQKKRTELQHCTFAPRIYRTQSQGVRINDPVHSRLHKEGELLHQMRKTKQAMYKDKELDGCTFHPRTSASQYLQNKKKSSDSISSRELITDPCERLYLDHEKKARALAKNEVDREEKFDRSCPFKPTVVSKRRLDEIEQNIPIHEKLYARHMQRQMLLEQKRIELQAEERRMQRYVSQCKENNKNPVQHCNSARSVYSGQDAGRTGEDEAPLFERLHRLHRAEEKKKTELEQGATFSPRINNKSMQLVRNERRSLIARSETFLNRKAKKLASAVQSGMSECTFKPRVMAKRASSPQNIKQEGGASKGIVERLYAYLDYYEKRKEDYKHKLGSE